MATKGKKISAEELQRLRLVFDKYKTEDDKIHKEGLVLLLKAEGSADPQSDVKDLLEAIDVNHDGVISYGEFLKAYYQNSEDIDHFLKEIVHAQHIHPVEFVYHAPHYAHAVKLAGPWNHWHGETLKKDATKGDHVYVATVKLPEGRVHYKYILKVGEHHHDHWQWEIDHTKPSDHLGHHLNNYVDVKKH